MQVTYRKGRPLAAYLHLSHHTGEKSAKTVPSPDGLLVVDYGADGQPMGVEITAPLAVSLERLNKLLAELGGRHFPNETTCLFVRPERDCHLKWRLANAQPEPDFKIALEFNSTLLLSESERDDNVPRPA